ncbi:hypothetical protein INT47_007444 [Mucor saturninus]|uniref:Uncharacterized protein n=1 Tax=Mucor saturninus TaxID=64648 RepID=A0A8H7R0C3_9FUNG|nr:hypothetical protein INT47_007444 [Mucor saturninus]
MNQYYTRLSFEKLENFDMRKSSLSSFVLVRNSLITALTKQQQQHYYEETLHSDMMLFHHHDDDDDNEKDVEQEGEGWLDSCFQELDQVERDLPFEEESDEEDMPLSPQDTIDPFYNKKKTFFINEDEEDEDDALICYDIPFLSLVERH